VVALELLDDGAVRHAPSLQDSISIKRSLGISTEAPFSASTSTSTAPALSRDKIACTASRTLKPQAVPFMMPYRARSATFLSRTGAPYSKGVSIKHSARQGQANHSSATRPPLEQCSSMASQSSFSSMAAQHVPGKLYHCGKQSKPLNKADQAHERPAAQELSDAARNTE